MGLDSHLVLLCEVHTVLVRSDYQGLVCVKEMFHCRTEGLINPTLGVWGW